MMLAVPAGRDAAVDAVRRLLSDSVAGNAPAIPVSAVAALNQQADSGSRQEALLARLAGRAVPAVVVERIDARSGVVDIEGARLRVEAGLPPAGAPVLLRFAPAASTATPLPLAGTAAQVSLGAVAQALSEVAHNPPAALDLGAVPAPVDSPARFAEALGGMVRTSGVFYESHVAQWSRGQYPLDQLQREPQAAAGGPQSQPPIQPESASHAPPAIANGNAPAASVPETSQPLVREQLGLLENRGISFLFNPWPGQQARLDIVDERERQAAAGQEPADAAWITTLRLELPQLGRVDARLSLVGNRLQLALGAADAAQPRMNAGSNALRAALAEAGITLGGLTFHHADTPG
jgi:hypothetical protein